MFFETNELYHIYNQGNDRHPIFFSRENYLFFLRKLKQFILPHADILAWCLMPNHFHLMVYVHTLENSDSLTQSETITKTRDLNNSIGLILRSYTRAINKQENRTGSLFKLHTKAECITKAKGITPSFYTTFHGTVMKITDIEKEYPQVCFNYIHSNPVVAGLVDKAEGWEFSSYSDYCGLRDGKLINKKRAEEFGLHWEI